MSRIGNQPIELPKGVDIQIEGSGVTVKGPRGQLSDSFNSDIAIEESGGIVKVSRPSDESEHKAFHGLTRSLVFNMVEGVSKGYTKSLTLKGVGYRSTVQGNKLNLTLGYSHPVVYGIPKGIEIKVEKQTNLC